MTDEFNNARMRTEAHATFADYLEHQPREGLVMLIADPQHQKNVFASYRGTRGEHADAILNELERREREAVPPALYQAAEAALEYLQYARTKGNVKGLLCPLVIRNLDEALAEKARQHA